MLTAQIGNNTINCYDGKYARDTLKNWDKKNILLCPVCKKPYRYHHGKVAKPYFQHKDKNECLIEYYEPETEEHIQGKIELYKWIKNIDGVTDVVLEGWMPETKQRPDVMFKYKDRQYVIEYQCKPIASEYIERHELYEAAGINDIWILGIKNYKINIVDNYINLLSTNRCIYNKCAGFFNYISMKLFIRDDRHLYYYELNDKEFYGLDLLDVMLDFNKNVLCVNDLKCVQIEDARNMFYTFFNELFDKLSEKEFNTYTISFREHKATIVIIEHSTTACIFEVKKDTISCRQPKYNKFGHREYQTETSIIQYKMDDVNDILSFILENINIATNNMNIAIAQRNQSSGKEYPILPRHVVEKTRR